MTKLTGLADQQVAERRSKGLVNQTDDQTSRSLGDILRANVLTPFNGLIAVLALAILLVRESPINSLFFVAMLLNIVIGVVQEVKAKRVLDKLAIMVEPTVKVIRCGHNQTVGSQDVVVDDLVVLGLGDQVVVDGVVVWSDGLEIDESLLTGEADAIAKQSDDRVLSGSIVTSGNGVIRATVVGNNSYAARLSHEAKQFKRASSELISATNTIMRWIARILLVVAPILVIGQLKISNGDWPEAIVHTVAAIVGMIPEGLVLLTSMAFLLAVVKLARQKVLVQQLPAVETLARVNTLLLDKTGTITEGRMKLAELIDINDDPLARRVIATMASRSSSPTNNALWCALKKYGRIDYQDEIPFNSKRKWSAMLVNDQVYVLGAPEIVLGSGNNKVVQRAADIADRGSRVLALVKCDRWPNGDALSDGVVPIMLIVLTEKIRSDARQTLEYFGRQGVAIKIISGDSPRTVGAVARQVGLDVRILDARDLPDAQSSAKEFLRLVQANNVFGRVKPEQKRQIAAALQSVGEVVAMTGDGVNDALALKRADLGIAMSSGTPATKSVAEVVLMDNKFSHLPAVLSEGRRVVANIERVSNLFLIKNVYTVVLSLAVTALGLTYPFLPVQMTVIGALTIGIPAFFLALVPNDRRYQPGFLRRVLSFSLPTGLVMATAMFACYYMVDQSGINLQTAGTSVSIVTMLIGLLVLIELAWPMNWWKSLLALLCGLTFFALVLWSPLAGIFEFTFDFTTVPVMLIVTGVAMAIAVVFRRVVGRRLGLTPTGSDLDR